VSTTGTKKAIIILTSGSEVYHAIMSK